MWIGDIQRDIQCTGQPTVLTKADAAPQRVIKHCAEECEALLLLLRGLKSKSTRAGRVCRSVADFKLAVRAMRKEGKITRSQQTLETLKNDLRLHIGQQAMWVGEQIRSAFPSNG